MKTIKLILATALVALCVCSCGKDESTPETVAERFVSALDDSDFEEAASLMVLPEGSSVKDMATFLEELNFADKFEGATFKIGKAKIDEKAGTATVKATLIKDGEADEDELPLKKVDGKWKINMF